MVSGRNAWPQLARREFSESYETHLEPKNLESSQPHKSCEVGGTDWEAAEAFAGCGEDGVGDRGGEGRQARLA